MPVHTHIVLWRNGLCVHFTLKALLYWVGFDPVSFRTKSALTSGPTPPFFCFLSYFLSFSDVHRILYPTGLSDSQHSLRTWLLRPSVVPITVRIASNLVISWISLERSIEEEHKKEVIKCMWKNWACYPGEWGFVPSGDYTHCQLHC